MQNAPAARASTRAERRRAAKLAKRASRSKRTKGSGAAPAAAPDAVRSGAARASAVLCALNYRPDQDGETLYREHRAWAERYGAPLYPQAPDFANQALPDRPLRVGYVSGDFRRHPVAFFIEPLLRQHDRAAIRPFCYSTQDEPDDMNRHLRSLVPDWRDIGADSDNEIAARIVADRIDILVDLSGHTAQNRLLVFARRPAPVQVTGLGYVATTGLATMDYRLTDDWCDPPDLTDAHYSETLWRLPGGFNCYVPPAGLPDPGPLPSAQNGHVTFGCFNNLDKVGDAVLTLWGESVAAVPDARLTLKTKSLDRPAVRKRVLDRLAKGGLAPERVTLIDWSPTLRAHFEHYRRIDIALDPFPYNGTTTTCEALMMGVPVIALIGDRHAARVSLSLLARLGLEDLAASDPAGYRERAQALAGDPDRLSTLRGTLRGRLAASPLVDAAGYTRGLETAYRDMWHRWCAQAR